MAKGKVCSRVFVRDDSGKAIGQTFTFNNGNSHTVTYADFSEAMRAEAEAQGFNHTLGDSFSGSNGDGNVAEGMFLARLDVLKGGEWKTSERGGGMAQEDLAQALAEITKRPIEEARKRVAEEDKAWRDARLKRADVKAIIARRVAERKAKKAEEVDLGTEDLL